MHFLGSKSTRRFEIPPDGADEKREDLRESEEGRWVGREGEN